MRVRVDSSELRMFEVELGLAAEEVPPEARKVVAKGSLNIKNDARRMAPKGPHLPYYANSINYETGETRTTSTGEIGPRKEPDALQGDLGHLLEYGGPKNPPYPHLMPAADREEPRFYQAMEDMAARLLRERHG